jgi:hypothetical protein
MHSISLSKILRQNQHEVVRRWHDDLSGNIAEDFRDMLETPMGTGVAAKLLSMAIEYLEAEDYQKNDLLRRMRNLTREASFRRSAVGFALPDIVFTALAFRQALEETILNHVARSDSDDEVLVAGILALNRLGDAMVSGEIAGYLGYLQYRGEEEDFSEGELPDEDRDVA